jgi:hypothetical protein
MKRTSLNSPPRPKRVYICFISAIVSPASSLACPPADSLEGALLPPIVHLNGTWTGPCFASPQGDGSYNQLTFRMTTTDWDLDYGAFGDDACTAKFLTVNIQGPYELGSASSVAPGAREGKFGFATKTVTPHMDAAVGVINGACGVTDAAVGEPFDLSAGCAGLGAYPIQECGSDYDIVMLSGDTLHFGSRPADNNMCTPDKRPSKFEGGAQVTRQ